jgi:AraC-like DNA-binding protein
MVSDHEKHLQQPQPKGVPANEGHLGAHGFLPYGQTMPRSWQKANGRSAKMPICAGHYDHRPLIPSCRLDGAQSPFPDILHIEAVVERTAELDWQIAPHRHLHLLQVFLIQSVEVRLSIDGKPQHHKTPLLVNVPRGHAHGFAFSAGTVGQVLTLPAGDFPVLFGPQTETQAALERALVIRGAGLLPVFEALARLNAAQEPLRRLQPRAAAVALCCAVAELGGPARPKVRPGDARMRVQEVGYAPGFDDPAYHARAFRRVLGISASDYRRRLEAEG